MKLSTLAYLCIKNSLYMDNESFNEQDFVDGKWDNSTDFATAIVNVFTPLNEAISRLNDLNKIPYTVVEINSDGNLLDLSKYSIQKVLNVAQLIHNDYKRIENRPFGRDMILLTSNFSSRKPFYVEFKQEIPVFSRLDFYDNDKDLYTEYGINNAMCQYIIEYVGAKFYESTDPNVSNMHITRAEQYFANIDTATMCFSPKGVNNKYSIGE